VSRAAGIPGRILASIASSIPCSNPGRIAGSISASALGVILVVMAGCGGSSAPPPAAPKGPTACERASDSMVGAMLARLPSADAPTERADALRNLIRERCEQDRWSDEATRCLIAMKQLDDAAPCAKLLTDDQQAALVRDQEAWLGGGGGGRGAAGPAGDR
jgi:hypothetical protein